MTPPSTPKVTLFTRFDCHLCDAARFVIERVAHDVAFDLEIIDIDAPGQQTWRRSYDHHVPVVHVNGAEVARRRVEEASLRVAIVNATKA